MPMASSRLLSSIRNAIRMLEHDECGLSEEQEESAMKELEYYMSGVSHFGELTARSCIATMFYYKGDAEKKFGPYVDYERMKELYENIKTEIADYNEWDFAVTLNLMYTEHAEVVRRWTKGEERLEKRMTELAVSWLNDEVTNHLSDKIWWYINCC